MNIDSNFGISAMNPSSVGSASQGVGGGNGQILDLSTVPNYERGGLISSVAQQIANLQTSDPQTASTLRDSFTSQLSAVEKGEFLRATDNAQAPKMGSADMLSNIVAAQKNTPISTKPPRAANYSPLNAKTLANIKSPEKAPAAIQLPAQVVKQGMENSKTANKQGAGIVISNLNADKKSGGKITVTFEPAKGSERFGVLTAVPNTQGSNYVPEIGQQVGNFMLESITTVVMQNGNQQAMLVRTDKTPELAGNIALTNEYNTMVNERKEAGFSHADAVHYSNMEIAQKYGLAYYEGSNGKLQRVDTTAAGKPGFKDTP